MTLLKSLGVPLVLVVGPLAAGLLIGWLLRRNKGEGLITALNRMNQQTAALVLLTYSGGFVVLAIYTQQSAVQLAIFGLSQNLLGGCLLMLKATGKEVSTYNAAGSNVAQQTVAADAPAVVDNKAKGEAA